MLHSQFTAQEVADATGMSHLSLLFVRLGPTRLFKAIVAGSPTLIQPMKLYSELIAFLVVAPSSQSMFLFLSIAGFFCTTSACASCLQPSASPVRSSSRCTSLVTSGLICKSLQCICDQFAHCDAKFDVHVNCSILLEMLIRALEARLHKCCVTLSTSAIYSNEMCVSNFTLTSDCDATRQSASVMTASVAELKTQSIDSLPLPSEMADTLCERDRRRALLHLIAIKCRHFHLGQMLLFIELNLHCFLLVMSTTLFTMSIVQPFFESVICLVFKLFSTSTFCTSFLSAIIQFCICCIFDSFSGP